MSEEEYVGTLVFDYGTATPSIDMGQPIVRCRDCRHYHSEFNGCDEFGDIWHDEYATVEPNGYCAWGKWRGDA